MFSMSFNFISLRKNRICFENQYAARAPIPHNLNFIPWCESQAHFSKMCVKPKPDDEHHNLHVLDDVPDARLVHILSIQIANTTFLLFFVARHGTGIRYVYNGLSVKPHSAAFRATKIHCFHRTLNSKSSCRSIF